LVKEVKETARARSLNDIDWHKYRFVFVIHWMSHFIRRIECLYRHVSLNGKHPVPCDITSYDVAESITKKDFIGLILLTPYLAIESWRYKRKMTHNAWSTMSSNSSGWGCKRNWSITVKCKKNNWLWLVNFLLLQPHPLLLLLIVNHA